MTDDHLLSRAASVVASAEALLIGAGAGMGVDSGLPDFRGDRGFWKAYPRYEQLGLTFSDLANPEWFDADPPLAWGFYGHRLGLYRTTVPHDGFEVLLAWARRMAYGSFVYTSNVDGQFQRAGFSSERILEIHGSMHWMQCTADCGIGIFSAGPVHLAVDDFTMRACPPLPQCPSCGCVARPNVLMFRDMSWDDSLACGQQAELNKWLQVVERSRVCCVELGAGLAIPSVRQLCEQAAVAFGTPLIRINPFDSAVSDGNIGLRMSALAGLQAINSLLQ